jgi:hypothetical protein
MKKSIKEHVFLNLSCLTALDKFEHQKEESKNM